MAKPKQTARSSKFLIYLLALLALTAVVVLFMRNQKLGADSSTSSGIPLKMVTFRFDSTKNSYIQVTGDSGSMIAGAVLAGNGSAYATPFSANYYRLNGTVTPKIAKMWTVGIGKYIKVIDGTFAMSDQLEQLNINQTVGFKLNAADSKYYASADISAPKLSGGAAIMCSIKSSACYTVSNIASGTTYDVSYFTYNGTLTVTSGKLITLKANGGGQYLEVDTGSISFAASSPKGTPVPIVTTTSFLQQSDSRYYSTSVQPNICDIINCTKKTITGNYRVVLDGKSGTLNVTAGNAYSVGPYNFIEITGGTFTER